MRFAPEGEFEAVLHDMTNAVSDVLSGEITTATRSVEIDGVTVEQGQIIALLNGKLVLSASELEQACLGLLQAADASSYELITLFSGDNVDQTEAERIKQAVMSAYPDKQVEMLDGGQPYYQFIISIE